MRLLRGCAGPWAAWWSEACAGTAALPACVQEEHGQLLALLAELLARALRQQCAQDR